MRVAHHFAGHSVLLSCKYCLTLTPCLDCLTAYCPLLPGTQTPHTNVSYEDAWHSYFMWFTDWPVGQRPVAGQTLGIAVVCTPFSLFQLSLVLTQALCQPGFLWGHSTMYSPTWSNMSDLFLHEASYRYKHRYLQSPILLPSPLCLCSLPDADHQVCGGGWRCRGEDLPFDLLHNQQVPFRICPHGGWHAGHGGGSVWGGGGRVGHVCGCGRVKSNIFILYANCSLFCVWFKL